MNSNSFLLAFGMIPEDFDRTDGPIESDEGFVYEAWEAKKKLSCPKCGSFSTVIKSHYTSEIKLRSDILKSEILCCHRIKYICKDCKKTFTNCLKGAMVGKAITYQERATILAELNKGDTFERVAAGHGISKTQVIRIFDDAYPKVERKKLPKILLIDEFKFKTPYSKYCCHLVDFETSQSIDIIKSRQKAYLDEYFSAIPEEERLKVKVLITDMYDEYANLAKKWLPKAYIVADRFHVVKQLTEAVNRIRVITMSRNEKDTTAYNFMKSKWKLFLTKKNQIPDKYYTRKSDGMSWHYADLVNYCLDLNHDLRNAYDCLQDLYKIMRLQESFSNSVDEISFVAQKLENCNNEILSKVADTYKKWKFEIAKGIAKNEFGCLLTNAKMEAANDVAQTMIDQAYGYNSFDRFRKRFLLMRWHKKA